MSETAAQRKPAPLRHPDARELGRRGGTAWRRFRSEGVGPVLRHGAGLVRRAWQLKRYDLNLRRLTRRLDAVPVDRPVFIIGVQGGGGTILARTLYRHPQVVYASGNASYWAGYDEIHNCPHTMADLPEPLIHRSAHFYNVAGKLEDHPRFGFQRSWLYATDEFLPQYRKGANDATEPVRQGLLRVIRKLILAYATDPACARFVDMSQLYTIQIPFLEALLGASRPRFVLLSRNPYVSVSRAAAKEYVGFGIPGELDAATRLRCAVEHWANSFRSALEDGSRVPLLHVRYEDFLADPEAVVRRICDFAELEFHPRQLPGPGQPMPLGSLSEEKWYPLRADENARYLAGISSELIDALNHRAQDVIERLGYEVLEP